MLLEQGRRNSWPPRFRSLLARPEPSRELDSTHAPLSEVDPPLVLIDQIAIVVDAYGDATVAEKMIWLGWPTLPEPRLTYRVPCPLTPGSLLMLPVRAPKAGALRCATGSRSWLFSSFRNRQMVVDTCDRYRPLAAFA
jgi:hypothetical protein